MNYTELIEYILHSLAFIFQNLLLQFITINWVRMFFGVIRIRLLDVIIVNEKGVLYYLHILCRRHHHKVHANITRDNTPLYINTEKCRSLALRTKLYGYVCGDSSDCNGKCTYNT